MIEVAFGENECIKGTLTLPKLSKPPYPAFLLLPGSGVCDRNGNSFSQKSNILLQLSRVIGRLGYATLRYDKRGVGESAGIYHEIGLYDRVDDAESAIQYLIRHPQIDPTRLFVLGHSEGTILASTLTQRTNIQGLILLTAPFDLLEQTFLMQAKNIEQSLINGSKSLFPKWIIKALRFDVIKHQKRLFEKVKNSDKSVLRFVGKKINAKWMREAFQWDGKQVFSSVTCPTLIINGYKDLQVQGDDAYKIASSIQGPTECHVLNDLTHILRKDFDEPSFLHYQKLLSKPLDADVVSIIENWLRAFTN